MNDDSPVQRQAPRGVTHRGAFCFFADQQKKIEKKTASELTVNACMVKSLCSLRAVSMAREQPNTLRT